MTRTGYDSVTPENIPAEAEVVAGYDDGWYAWGPGAWERFPTTSKIHIAVHPGTNTGVCLDVETGDANPEEAVGWVQMRRAQGIDPWVYCSDAIVGQVFEAFDSAGIPRPHIWRAAYPGIGPYIYPGDVGHQYEDPGPYDLSVFLDQLPGVDLPSPPEPTPPSPPPTTSRRGQTTMIQYTLDGIPSVAYVEGDGTLMQKCYYPPAPDHDGNGWVTRPLTAKGACLPSRTIDIQDGFQGNFHWYAHHADGKRVLHVTWVRATKVLVVQAH